jgi:hypothetical protein
LEATPVTLLPETAETARATDTITASAGAARSRHRPRRDSDRWSRWADSDQELQAAGHEARVA